MRMIGLDDERGESLGALLRHYRSTAGLTQEALAERAGLSPRSIFGLERGESRPHLDTAERLARALSLSGDDRSHFLDAARIRPHRASGSGRAPPGGTASPRLPDPARQRLVDRRGFGHALSGHEPISSNLPLSFTSFIGREHELDQLSDLLGDPSAAPRLLTLTGPGGCGKTRLALEVAARFVRDADRPTSDSVRAIYPDGVWLVELGPVANPKLVPRAVAAVLEVPEQPRSSLPSTLVQSLGRRRLLLVLDNCEQVATACARLAAVLLRGCPHLRILVTSQQILGITGEVSWRVPSLSTPPRGSDEATGRLVRLEQYEAVRLFVARALAASPTFRLAEANALAVARVCQRLDGIPLALELAAARLRSLTVEEVERGLSDRFRLLRGGSPVALPRHQTLRALVDWSHDLLAPDERTLFRRLAVFAGGFGLDPAVAVAWPPGELPSDAAVETLDCLSRLVEKSLLIAEDRGSETRYRLLETLRQYAEERLVASGEVAWTSEHHARHYLALAREADRALVGPDQVAWLARLDLEDDNLRAAIAWSVRNDAEIGLGLVGALQRFWHARGYVSDESRWADALIATARQRSDSSRAALLGRALTVAGELARVQGRSEYASAVLDEAVAVLREAGDADALSRALNERGIVAYEVGASSAAVAFHRESLAIQRRNADSSGAATSLAHLGIVAANQGDYVDAAALYEESLALHRRTGNAAGLARALSGLGLIARTAGDQARAATLYEESLSWRRALGDRRGIAHAVGDLATVAVARGDDRRAEELYQESLAIYRAMGDRRGEAWELTELGAIASRRGDHERATRLIGEALRTHQEIGNPGGVANALIEQGFAAIRQGDVDRAGDSFLRGAVRSEELGEPSRAARCVEGAAAVAAARGDLALAARLLSAVARARAALHLPVPLADRAVLETTTARIQLELGAASTIGEQCTLGDALREAREFLGLLKRSTVIPG